MAAPIEISKQTARRFVLGKQGLWPGRRWAGKDGTRSAMRAVEQLQLDPLQIVARSHDLMLHARVAGYRPEYFSEVTYEERGFFDWGGWLAVRPMEELPYWRTIMLRERNHDGVRHEMDEHPGVVEAMRAELRDRPMLSAEDVGSSGRAIVKNYRGGKDTSLALYYLWRTGEAMTHHRDGFERVYALSERVAPAHLLEPAPAAEADLFIARKSVAFGGIGRIGEGRPGSFRHWLSRAVTQQEVREFEETLVGRGELTRVQVEGWRTSSLVPTADLGLLERVDAGLVPNEWSPLTTSTTEEVTFLSPLDPVSARGRAKVLFDFEYLWEVYMRPDQVKYGRFTMPILWGDSLVGRTDLRMDRKAKTLAVNGVWFEDAATAKDGAFVDALAVGLSRLVAFLGASEVDASAVTNRSLRARLRRAASASL